MKKRLQSLDVFRGITVFFMIIVNSTGNWDSTYAPLLHAKWHGFTPTDLVFPSFLFAVGSSMAIVLPRWKEKLSAGQVYAKVFKRGFIIFLLGFLMYWFPFFDWLAEGGFEFRPLGETRVLGVLQRIAIAYALAAILIYHFSVRSLFWIAGFILLAYWFVMSAFGDLTMTGNVGHWLDMKILGANHLYGGEGVPFDPEGLLSTVPCLVNVIAGYLTVHYLRNQNEDGQTKLRLVLVGAICTALACLWHYGFPINKKLWTSSYALLTSGIAVLMLVGLYYLLDQKDGEANWAKFFAPMGKNPLFIYLLSEVGVILLAWVPNATYGNYYSALYETVFRNAGDYLGAFLFALAWTLVCWAVAKWMDARSWYVRV